MSYNYQQKKRNSSDTSDPSTLSSEDEKCDRGQNYDQWRPCIVCPPCDYKEKYDSSGSDYSCPDFSNLCEDKSRIHCEKKSEYVDDSDESTESEDESISKKCNGCDRDCRECIDFSRSSVLQALGSSEPNNECGDFNYLVHDEKRKQGPLFDNCNRKNISQDKKSQNDNQNKKSQNKKSRNDNQNKTKTFKNDDQDKKSKQQSYLKESSSSSSSSTSSSSSSSSSTSRGKKFVVSFGPKEGHQWAKYNEGDESIHINGKNGPVLHLYRGSTYFFCIEQSNVHDDSSSDAKHFFFLTDSPSGGVGSQSIKGGFAPVSKGTVCFKVDQSTPRYFFYQSPKQTFEGGLVIVHDK